MARCIQSSDELGQLSAYQLEYEEALTDISAYGLVLRHIKTGARICVISNEDDNKVFSIGFRTPPADSTGVAHIIEHSVLCGSEKFPLKDPFIELAKGSLNTFLNAMTFSDKTIYPVASCNEKDFQNLMDVYMDAVLHPNIYHQPEIFYQEGWHYALEAPEDTLTLNGVVYSEMKGVFSEPEQILARDIEGNLLPDTAYGNESGGDPEAIPDLTYENFLEFHRRYYHPTNSYIYLYGNMDIEEKLNWLDETYLSAYTYQPVDSELELQEPFGGMREVEQHYAVTEQESTEKKSFLAYGAVIGTALDHELIMAFQILSRVLIEAPGAPVKQALIDAQIGDDIFGYFSSEVNQPYFSIAAKGAEAADQARFLQIIRETLETLVREGINKKSLLAAINSAEFRYREADYGRFPKGLLYGISLLSTWLYDDDAALVNLHQIELFQKMKERANTNYFETLIEKYLLASKHALSYRLLPMQGLNRQKEEALQKKLQAYRDSLSPEEIEALVKQTAALKTYQEEPTSPENLEKIPLLARSDIETKAAEYISTPRTENGLTVLHQNYATNGIVYFRLLFDVSDIKREWVPYLRLLETALGYMNTEHYSYLELSNEIDIHTGGFGSSIETFGRYQDVSYYRPMLTFSAKALHAQMPEVYRLLEEILFRTKLSDTKRLQEILRETKARLEMKMSSRGDATARGRAASYDSQEAMFTELTSGVAFYRFVCDLLDEFETKQEELISVLTALTQQLLSRKNLLVTVTADEDGYQSAVDGLTAFAEQLYGEKAAAGAPTVHPGASFDFALEKKNEGFVYSGQVQYVVCGGNYIKAGFAPTGALRVLTTILDYEYLWNRIRVKGGAYGCGSSFSLLDGEAWFSSYRDPNLKETLEVYRGMAEYIRSLDLDERELTKYIIGTMSSVDMPLMPSGKGARALSAFMQQVSQADRQRERDEILNVTVEQLRALGALVEAVVRKDCYCALGGEAKIQEEKALFGAVEVLTR